MKYLNTYKLFEASEHYHYYVVIEWEHGDADGKSLQRYPFKSEDEMDDFLHFIYDMRKFSPNSAWENAGHFEDGHYQRERKWIDKIDKKYGGRFSQLVPNDTRYRNGDYAPAVESIWVEQDGLPLNIIWEKALKTNIINLPKIGDVLKTNTGHISYYGPKLWGKTDMEYWGYDAFKHWDEDFECKECNGKGWVKDYEGGGDKKCPVCKGEHKYSDIDPIVTDCKIQVWEPYERKDYEMRGDREVLKSSYKTYSDYTSFQYVLLCEFAGAYITCDLPSPNRSVGFDPNYESKYHYPKYGTNDFYLVR
jgi:hypothetical protein